MVSVFLLYSCVISAAFFASKVAASDTPKIIAITSGASPVYDQVVEQLKKSLAASCRDESQTCLMVGKVVKATQPTETIVSQINETPTDLIITLGTRAATTIAGSTIKIPTLYTLLPETAFKKLPNCCQLQNSSIFLNQPLDRQIRLITTALPQHKRLGVIYGPSSQHAEADIKRLTEKAGLQLESVVIKNRDGVGAALRRLLKKVDVLLALPDPEVYSKQTVFNILLSSYHQGVPVIGFSKGYVKAGALLALYSSPEQIGQQLADVVKRYFSSKQRHLPPPQYPANFSVLRNKNVARSFKIPLPAEKDLHSAVLNKQ